MNKTILQVPLTRELKNNAEKIALQQGFSSLQEAVRVFLTKLAQKKVEIILQTPQDEDTFGEVRNFSKEEIQQWVVEDKLPTKQAKKTENYWKNLP